MALTLSRPSLFVLVPLVAAGLLASGTPHESHARAPSQTDVCGDIAPGTIWNAAGSPYSVTCTARIPVGSSLTVEPGVEVRFAKQLQLEVSGSLIVSGSSPSDVLFTSVESTQAKGDWRGIRIPSGGVATIGGLTVAYAGYRAPAIEASGELRLENSLIRDSGGSGVDVKDVSAAILSTTIRDGAADGIVVGTNDDGDQLELRDSVIRDNAAGNAVTADANVRVLHSGNTVSGNAVNGIVLTGGLSIPMTWQGGDMPYVLLSGLTTTAELTIERGVFVKVARSRDLSVSQGRIVVTGEGAERVHFTSLGDDRCASTGGRIDCDTDNDGNTAPQPGSWGQLRLRSPGESILENVEVSYGSREMVAVANSSAVRIANSRFEQAEGDALFIDAVPATIVDSEFVSNRGHAVRVNTRVPLTVTLQNSAFDSNQGAVASITADTSLVSGGNRSGLTREFTNHINGYLVSGRMTTPKTWLAGDLPYVVSGTVDVGHAAATLRLQPGLTLKMAPASLIDVSAGRLEIGGPGARVLITALADNACSAEQDSGCPTDGEDNRAPQAGNWRNIRIRDQSRGANLRNAVMRYGGGTGQGGTVIMEHAASAIEDVTIADSGSSGIHVSRVSTTIARTTVVRSVQHGISFEGQAAGPVIQIADVTLQNNNGSAIHMDANVQLEITGQNTATGNGANGVVVVDDVLDNRTWRATTLPYILADQVRVLNNKALTIEPGTIVKFDTDESLILERGSLVAVGTSETPIIFTSINDSTVGGASKTNSPSPNRGDWIGLHVRSTGVAGTHIENVEIRYAGRNGKAAVLVELPGTKIAHSRITEGGGIGVHLNNVPRSERDTAEVLDNHIIGHQGHGILMTATGGPTQPTVQRNTVQDTLHALQADANVQPVLGGNSVEDNDVNGLVISGDITVRRTWSRSELPWVMAGTINLRTSAWLSIEAGTIVKAMPEGQLRAERGILEVPKVGSGDDPVIFTSLRDDEACASAEHCDTDGLGDVIDALPGDWGGLRIASTAPPMQLENAQVRFAGQSDAAILLEAANSQIRNVTISESATAGIRANNAQGVVITNSVIRDNGGTGIILLNKTGATVTGNLLTGNSRSMVHQAEGAIVTANNVAIGNEFDAMLYCANVVFDQVWESDLAREVSCSFTVEAGVLTIEPGSIVQFQDNRGISVAGALDALGTIFAGSHSAAVGGAWRGLDFRVNSSGRVRHSSFFASGGSNGAISISSGRVDALYNAFHRTADKAIVVSNRTADTNIEGNLFGEVSGSRSRAIEITGNEASPVIRHNRFASVNVAVDVTNGLPEVTLNSFGAVREFGVNSSSRNRPCVNARANWWGHETGPNDPLDDGREACGPAINEAGLGVPVGKNVNYGDWLTTAPPTAPLIDLPRCGVTNQSQQQVAGRSSPGARVIIYDGDNRIGEVTVDSAGSFSTTVNLGDGEHALSFEARGASDELVSPRTGFRLVNVQTNLPADPAQLRFEYGPDGSRRIQPLRDEAGCSVSCGGPSSGRVALPPEVPVVVKVPAPGATSVVFEQPGADPVPLTQLAGEWTSPEFVPLQTSFSLRIDGTSATECMGYVYTGGGGFVFADTGAPGDPIFFHDFENGSLAGWGVEKWGIAPHGYKSSFSATDSPDGDYVLDDENGLYMPGPLDLRRVPAPILKLHSLTRIANGDRGEVQIQIGDTGPWRKIGNSFEGETDEWQLIQISLDDFAREAKVRFRFLMKSNAREPVADGWYIDNVTVAPGGRLNGRFEPGEPLVEGAVVSLLQRNAATGEWSPWDPTHTGQSNPQVTDEAGRYGFYNLPPGEYRVRVDSSPYGPAMGEVLAVWDGTVEYQFALRLGEPAYLPITAKNGRIGGR
jgi:hypothetical protein